MICYRKAAVERAMKVQEVILRAMANSRKSRLARHAQVFQLSSSHVRQPPPAAT